MHNKLVNYIEENKDVLREMKEALWEIPIDNMTHYQIKHHILDRETDEENYVQCLRQMDRYWEDVVQCSFRRDEFQVDLEELEYKINSANNKFEKRRLEIKKRKLEHGLNRELKYIEDRKHTLNGFFKNFKELQSKVGKLTREKYEKAMPKTWFKRLEREMELEYFGSGRIDHSRLKAYQDQGGQVAVSRDKRIMFNRENAKDLIEAGEE